MTIKQDLLRRLTKQEQNQSTLEELIEIFDIDRCHISGGDWSTLSNNDKITLICDMLYVAGHIKEPVCSAQSQTTPPEP